MISGRWGQPNRVLLDLAVDEQGNVSGIANPGAQNAPIRSGRFDATTGAVHLEGEHAQPGQSPVTFCIDGRLEGRTLHLAFTFGERSGNVEVVRVEEWRPKPRTLIDLIKPQVEDFQRWLTALTRPTGQQNSARRVAATTIEFRDAAVADIPALAELHVETWNMTYNTTRGPTVKTRTWQWNQIIGNAQKPDIVVVLADTSGRLIGFYRTVPQQGEWDAQLNKIYLRWEWHGLGLGRRMIVHAARRLLARGAHSMILFAERSNPTIGFYDRMGGERLTDDHGVFRGAYGWRDLRKLSEDAP